MACLKTLRPVLAVGPLPLIPLLPPIVWQMKKLAGAISREVLDLWAQVGRVVQYKHDQRVEAARLEARDRQLNFLVGQTARYTDLITEGMVSSGQEPAGEEEEDDDDEGKRPKVEKVDRQAELEVLVCPAPPLSNSCRAVLGPDTPLSS